MSRLPERRPAHRTTWNTDDSGPRKFYRVSPDGALVRTGLLREWQTLGASISRLTQGDR
ncbi:hypothetical protein ACIRQP_17570 [Streptomyces sp. NPDC102274]|uniref:hypothetical protein n=1 Tax=Streptomyces sp. NPDC102274 TaxID=3366151 RepID=UPI0037F5B576